MSTYNKVVARQTVHNIIILWVFHNVNLCMYNAIDNSREYYYLSIEDT